MIKGISGLFRVLVGLTAVFSLLTAGAADATPAFSVRKEICKIIQDKDIRTRTERASRLAMHLLNDKSGVSDSDIASLTALLKDRDDSVRYYAAMSLGLIGDRARSAIPALKIALAEIACIQLDKTSAPGIRLALTRLGSSPPDISCIG